MDLVTDNEWHAFFKVIFVCLKGCINGFMEGRRPFLRLDETHMSSRHKNVLLAAIEVDVDNQIFPLTFGMVEGESTSSWSWFCALQHQVIGGLPNLTFISNGQH